MIILSLTETPNNMLFAIFFYQRFIRTLVYQRFHASAQSEVLIPSILLDSVHNLFLHSQDPLKNTLLLKYTTYSKC